MKSALKLAKRKYRYSGDGGINAPAIRQKQVEFFSQLESQRITAAVLKKLDRSSLGYLLCLETGLRLGEVCALRWSDIDLAEGVLRVQRTVYRINYGKRTELVLQTPKSENSVRAIPLTAKMLSVLAPDEGQEGLLPAYRHRAASGAADNAVSLPALSGEEQLATKELSRSPAFLRHALH